MNYFDIALIIPIIYGMVQGFSRGIVKEVTSLVSLLIGVYIAINFSFSDPRRDVETGTAFDANFGWYPDHPYQGRSLSRVCALIPRD